MSESVTPATNPESCARCERVLSADERRPAGDRVFCATCYEVLREELRQAVTAMSTDIPYPAATLGALLGGAAGALVWWGFTALTHIAFGLLAVAIGFLVGIGTVRFAGGKRSTGLQAMAVGVSLLSFVAASYLVNRTFINQALAKSGEAFRVPLVPPNLELFVSVLKAGFGIMDVFFLGFAVYQAWVLTKPLRLPGLETPAR
jgi:hypothetical protein